MAVHLHGDQHLATGSNRVMVRIVLVAALVLTGCAPIDPEKLMGGTEGTPIPAPSPKLDCDLIFPAPPPDPVAP